jgi:predicted MFS family arabinose efflux permease
VNAQPAVRPRFDILAVIMLGGFLNFLVAVQLTPLVPAIARDLSVSIALAGQLAAVTGIVSFAGSLLAIPLMDRFSRRAWLRLQCVLLLAGIAVSVAAPSFAWLVAGRALSGLGLAVLSAALQTVARDVFDEPWRTRAVAWYVASMIFAFIVGLPVITAVDDAAGWRWALATTALPVLLLLAGTSLIPAERPGPVPAGMLGAFRAVAADREARWWYATLAAVLGAYAGWLTYFGAWLHDAFAMPAALLGLLFFVSGAIELVSDAFVPAAIRRWGPAVVSLAGAAVCAVPLLLSGSLFASIPAAFVMATLMNAGSATVIIAVNARLLALPTAVPGAMMSLAAAANGFAAWSGPLLAGWLLASTGRYPSAYAILGALSLAGAACAIMAGRGRGIPATSVPR